jgi:putative transposase
LFEAKKRYGLDILNYTVTSNHIHLLVVDAEREVIPRSLQLVAGKTAKSSTAGSSAREHFGKTGIMRVRSRQASIFSVVLVYIDLNMVRNGVVQHPSEWQHGGYNEIQNPPLRYALINR